MSTPVLPPDFAELEPWASDWALPTEVERNAKHLATPMRGLKAYYDAALPRLDDILAHLRSLEADGRAKSIPQASKNLFYLALSLAEISQSIEVHGQVGVVDGFPSNRWVPEHELPGWRALEQRLRPTPA